MTHTGAPTLLSGDSRRSCGEPCLMIWLEHCPSIN
jgi:hypothetical protein